MFRKLQSLVPKTSAARPSVFSFEVTEASPPQCQYLNSLPQPISPSGALPVHKQPHFTFNESLSSTPGQFSQTWMDNLMDGDANYLGLDVQAMSLSSTGSIRPTAITLDTKLKDDEEDKNENEDSQEASKQMPSLAELGFSFKELSASPKSFRSQNALHSWQRSASPLRTRTTG